MEEPKTKKVKTIHDSHGEPWPDIPIDEAETKRIEADNRQRLKKELAKVEEQSKIQNQFMLDWKYRGTISTPKVSDHRLSRWLEEAPLKGAKNLVGLVLLHPASLDSVYTLGFVPHLILPY